jgi:membrane protein required for colicin V production
LNWVDIFIAIALIVSIFLGWKNGVIKPAFLLIGAIIGITLAGRFWADVADLLPIDDQSIAKIAGFILILVLALIAAWLAARIAKRVLSLIFIGWVDSLLGALLGLITGSIAATSIISAMGILPSDTINDSVEESSLTRPLIEMSGFVYTLLPEDFRNIRDRLTDGLAEVGAISEFIEQSEELENLLGQGADVLQGADTIQDLAEVARNLTSAQQAGDLIVGFTGYSEFEGASIYYIVNDEQILVKGPSYTKVLQGGNAVVTIRGLDPDSDHELIYWVDANENGRCEVGIGSNNDTTDLITIPSGTATTGSARSDGKGENYCAMFSYENIATQ